jgi:hypothetical protein
MSTLVLDLHCGPCARATDPYQPQRAPRLARFVRDARGGPIGFQPFTVEGQKAGPYPRQRPDGGVTWQLLCPQGHNRPVKQERLVAAFEVFPAGQDSMLIAI